MSKDKTNWAGRLGRWTRLHLLRALRENASPGRTALGLALGAFIGIVPSFMVGAPLAFFLAGRLGWNRAAAVAGSVLSMNPLTAPFLYSLSAWLGFEITGRHVTVEVEGLINNLREYAFPFLVGNAVVALAIAVVLGLIMFFLVRQKGPRGMRAMVKSQQRVRPIRRATARVEESAEVRQTP
ncbi:MAG: DUF2062 domain-containing protein [Acidobacteria bacterium]|nr:DUF2062 domain-containing protein [Acidobacteriota bacterium]MDA1234105.1 DUF2062 domain-containing protein [Acidobacteriota bacterium]